MIATVLLVDDFTEFRAFITRLLRAHPGFQIVAEASDGLTAIQKAAELKPAIILLDISMPWMNGFDAARRIPLVSPTGKIIFVTEHDSSEMVERAFSLGADGYLVKKHLSKELLPALEAVVLGKKYVSEHVR